MPRMDLFTPVHKGLRALLYGTALEMQTTDFSDAQAAVKTTARLQHDMIMLHQHHTSEERFIFSELKPFERELVDGLLEAHVEVVRLITAVEDLIESVLEQTDTQASIISGDELNRATNDLIGYLLSHLAYEERTIRKIMWNHFNDEQLGSMTAKVQQSLEPEQLAEWLRWMFIGQNDIEVAGMLTGVKMSAPPPVFENIVKLAGATLGEQRWQKVSKKAGW